MAGVLACARMLARASSRLGVRCMSQVGAPLPLVGYALDDGVATLTLQSVAKRNALSSDMMAALSAALLRAEAHDGARVVVVQAAGPVFSAGHDLKELSTAQAGHNAAAAAAIFQQCR
jgi:enoyl-CoA hydratase/carnithine racemase